MKQDHSAGQRRRRVRLRSAAFATLAALVATMFTFVAPAQAAISIDTNAYYVIVNANSGKALDLWEWSTADGGEFRQFTRADGWNQQFQFVSSGDGYYRLKNRHSGKVVDVWGWSTEDGGEINQYTDLNGANQQWMLTGGSNSTVRFLNRNSGKALEVFEWSLDDGGDIAQWTDYSNANQTWQLVAVDSVAAATVASDGTGTYRTVQAAIDAVPANNTTRRVITIKAGTYRELVTIPSNKPYITLQGLGSSASQTTIVYNNSAASVGSTSGSASMIVDGHDFVATNLTISNDYGVGSQAVALRTSADRAVYDNVRVLGAQDTLYLYASGARSYFVNCYVEGTVDFIFGAGTGVFNNCSIYQKRSTGGPITAARTDASNAYGILIYRSTITGATNNTTQLGRPWGPDAQVLFRECSLSATIATAQPWIDMSGNAWENARFYEYANTGSGATTNSNRPQMSSSTAASYTPQRYLAGSDGWNPVG